MCAGVFRYCKIDRFFFREVPPCARGAQHRLAGPAILSTEILTYIPIPRARMDDQRVVDAMPHPLSSRPWDNVMTYWCKDVSWITVMSIIKEIADSCARCSLIHADADLSTGKRHHWSSSVLFIIVHTLNCDRLIARIGGNVPAINSPKEGQISDRYCASERVNSLRCDCEGDDRNVK